MVTKTSKIQGCLLGVMIGDAMGMPVEMMTPEQILEITDGKGITTFIEPIQRKLADTQGLKAGSTTDDWQLTRAVAESLIRCNRFDLVDQALAHVEAYETSTSGWGTTTRVGMRQLKEYFDTRGKSGRRPGELPPPVVNSRGEVSGCGNGVAMKAAPLGIWFASGTNYLPEYVFDQLCSLTHPDERAGEAAFTIGNMIRHILTDWHRPIFDRHATMNQLDPICYDTYYYELTDDLDPGSTDSFHSRLASLKDDTLIQSLDRLRTEIGTSCHSLESVPFSVALYLRNENDFRKGVLEAVNSGGDADSNASMVGAMIGLNVGVEGIPPEWIEFNPDFQEAMELGKRLAEKLGVE